MRRRTRPIVVHDAACPDFVAYLELRSAIQRHEFFLEYQPKVSLGSGLIEGFEALVRWNHRRLGRLPPDVFIPRLERTQLIQSLTWNVLDEALMRLAALQRRGFLLGMAVNVSPAAVTEELPRHIDVALKHHDVAASWLTLEITQSVEFGNVGRAHSILNAIHARGVHLSLDDFGTGWASLTYLQSLPFDEIKIDHSFVGQMRKSRREAEIVRLVTELGRALELRVVAEGVEDRKTLNMLHSFGVDAAQGYYLAPALDAADLLAELPMVTERAQGRNRPASARPAGDRPASRCGGEGRAPPPGDRI